MDEYIYGIWERDSSAELECVVNDQMRNGWRPLGNVSVCLNIGEGGALLYSQAMIKDDDTGAHQ